MQKVAEEWSTNTVLSTFQLLPGAVSGTTSELCGLGWRFTLNRDQDSSVSVHFDPHLVKSSSFGQLRISAQLGRSTKGTPSTSISYQCQHDNNVELINISAFSLLASPFVVVSVQFPDDVTLPKPPLGLPRMREVLYNTLSGHEFLDTKFHLFSRRRSVTTVGDWRQVFANSTILTKQSSYMSMLLSDSGFSEASTVDIANDLLPAGPDYTHQYGYESDSDLEDSVGFMYPTPRCSDSPDPCSPAEAKEVQPVMRSQDGKNPPHCDSSNSDTKESLIDVPRETNCVEQSELPIKVPSTVPEETICGPKAQSSDASTNTPPVDRPKPKASRFGHVVTIKDTAHTTWMAFIFYLYTGDIEFSELKSQTTMLRPSFSFSQAPQNNAVTLNFSSTSSKPESQTSWPGSPRSVQKTATSRRKSKGKAKASNAVDADLPWSSFFNLGEDFQSITCKTEFAGQSFEELRLASLADRLPSASSSVEPPNPSVQRVCPTSKFERQPVPATRPHYPPRCSPKSMYRLAEKIGLEELRKRSLEAIQSKLSKDNIVQELFSSFTYRYPEIIDMEMGIFIKHYSSPEVLQAFHEQMRRVTEGQMPWSWDVVSAVLSKLKPA